MNTRQPTRPTHQHALLSQSRRITPLAILLTAALLGGCGSVSVVPGPSTPPPVEESSGAADETPATPANEPENTSSPSTTASNGAALALLAQSKALQNNGELPRAIALVERAIRLEPSRGDLWVQLGRLRYDSGEYARAEQYARKGIALTHAEEPARRDGWLLLADVSDARGDAEGARQIRARWLNRRG